MRLFAITITDGYAAMIDVSQLNDMCASKFPGLLGITVVSLDQGQVTAEMPVTDRHLAPNGYLHAGSVVSLADTACGNGCIVHLPDGAEGFTTIELKSNHLGTVRDGVVTCVAVPVHKGRTTQVWDATVASKETGKTIAMFRCTQMLLYPK